jgi:hypothetical protein
MARVASVLREHGHHISIASRCYYECDNAVCVQVLDWRSIDPREVDFLIFVCGPLIPESESFQQLTKHFETTRSLAVGVSILPSASLPFQVILARDGTDDAFGDFAFDPSEFPQRVSEGVGQPGLCLRGHQREYGEENCLHGVAGDIAHQIVERFSDAPLILDTRLHGEARAASRIIEAFRRCSFVVTTRLHGALLALALGRPAVAIDQIRGGAKVSGELGRLGWPLTYRADHEGVAEEILRSIDCLQRSATTQSLHAVQAVMRRSIARIQARLLAELKR